MNAEQYGWPRWAKVVLGVTIVCAGVVGGILLHNLLTDVGNSRTKVARTVDVSSKPDNRKLEAELKKLQREQTKSRGSLPPASAGSNGTASPPSSGSSSAVLGPGAERAFQDLESSLGAEIGVSVAPFGSTVPVTFGSKTSGHAWSSLKVPIVVTVMKRGPLSAAQESQASAAITASDNEAAAALFASLGAIPEASAAVEQVLAESGSSTAVSESPPPSGAVSTWGQTDWSLEGSVNFYRALACDQLLGEPETDYVLGLMESVISEQRWGLPNAGINGEVAIKAGWGPDGSASGPYLVRQAGVLRSSDHTGAVVTIAAQDSSGSFEAGVQDLEAVAGWVAENVRIDAGSC